MKTDSEDHAQYKLTMGGGGITEWILKMLKELWINWRQLTNPESHSKQA